LYSNLNNNNSNISISLSEYLDIDNYKRYYNFFWEKENKKYNFNQRETERLSSWRKNYKSEWPIIFKAYGNISRSTKFLVKPKIWWLSDKDITKWISQSNTQNYKNNYKNNLKKFKIDSISNIWKKLKPYDSLKSSLFGSYSSNVLIEDVKSKFTAKKFIKTYNFKVWKRLVENKPLRRVLKKFENEEIGIFKNISENDTIFTNIKKLDLDNIFNLNFIEHFQFPIRIINYFIKNNLNNFNIKNNDIKNKFWHIINKKNKINTIHNNKIPQYSEINNLYIINYPTSLNKKYNYFNNKIIKMWDSNNNNSIKTIKW